MEPLPFLAQPLVSAAWMALSGGPDFKHDSAARQGAEREILLTKRCYINT